MSATASPFSPPEALSAALDRVFAGARDEALTLAAFLKGLEGRAYPFAVAAIDFINCIPTGIPWMSTITGVPMVLLLVQMMARFPAPSLPHWIGRKSLPRGRLQDFMGRSRRWLVKLERLVRPRHEWLVEDLPGLALRIALFANAVLLALPIPFDNLLPAWAIMFFAMALLERDGGMAILGWLFTVLTAIWTVILLAAGREAIRMALEMLFG